MGALDGLYALPTATLALRARQAATTTPVAAETPRPANHHERSHNELRPRRLNDLIGQDKLKRFLRRVLDAADARDQVLDHMLLVAASGTGKSTIANIVANELHTDCYQLQAPVSHGSLLGLADVLREGDVVFIDEIHQQAIAERRGRNASTEPEILYQVLEDRTILTATGVQAFPKVTFIGATTDEGMLPDAFVNRFPLRPILDSYNQRDLARIAKANAQALDIDITVEAALIFARASRGVPRQINNYVRNAAALTVGRIDDDLATEVVRDLNRTTDDGLTLDMQRLLVFLYRRGKHTNAAGDVSYHASVSTLATAIGKSRDTKSIVLRVEPFLIERGFLQVGHGGRSLTTAGLKRARELSKTQR